MTNENLNNEDMRKRLFDDESYDLLKEAQRKVREATEVTPPMRKMINELITPESIERVIALYISKYK